MLVPTDWSFDGQVQYAQHLVAAADIVKLTFRAASPDGRTGIELFPDQNWGWAEDAMMRQAIQNQHTMAARMNGPQTVLMPPLSARDFLTRVGHSQARPGATVSGVEPIPDAEAPISSSSARPRLRPLGRGSASAQGRSRPRRIHTTAGGTERGVGDRGHLHAGDFPACGQSQGAQSSTYQCAARYLFDLRAPEGALDANDALYRTVLATVRIDPRLAGSGPARHS